MPAELKKVLRGPFSDYSAYVSKLRRLAAESLRISDWDSRVDAALNGQASVELRLVSPVETRRKFGAFFTGTDLGSKLIGCGAKIDETSVFYDPTCGMGDLLVAAARKLPLSETLPDTLLQWGQQLTGTDLHSEFIQGARARLILLARQRHRSEEQLQVSNAGFFPHIRVADGLKQHVMFGRATRLLLNPPFGQVVAPAGCKWAGGRITEAAAFLVAALERARSGVEMLAILPEVLRSGSFSEQWRKRVSELAEIKLVEPYGIFDDSADIDVFLLRLIRRERESIGSHYKWIPPAGLDPTTISDFFHVHVGRVVPHRDKRTGEKRSYIHPRCVPTWKILRHFSETRRHLGLGYKPPFVVIRRTSRPGDSYRATASIIAGKNPVFVENHLIVCEPKDGKFATCRVLLKKLKTERANIFLDARIRCRHLTVGAVREIPWLF